MTAWSAGRYQAVAQLIAPIAAKVVAAAAPHPGDAVVDLACGTGSATLAAAASGAAVTGVDLTAELIAIAKTEPGADAVTWVTADASATGLPDASFDAAVSNMGIIFVEPVAMVAELARLLKPGGTLAFSTWVKAVDTPLFTPIAQVFGAQTPAGPTPDQWGEADMARSRLDADFAEVTIENHTFTWQFDSLEAAVRFVTDESPMHVNIIGAVDEATRARLVEAFASTLAAHRRTDGRVEFDTPYAIVRARRRGQVA